MTDNGEDLDGERTPPSTGRVRQGPLVIEAEDLERAVAFYPGVETLDQRAAREGFGTGASRE